MLPMFAHVDTPVLDAHRNRWTASAIVRQDPTLGEWAQVAADGLTAGEGEEVLGQAFVQDFLWYRLPAKYPERAWFALARAAERHIVMSVHRPLYFWRLFGLLEEVRPRWVEGRPTGPNVTSLTPAGRVTALEYLRARAVAPRRSLQT